MLSFTYSDDVDLRLAALTLLTVSQVVRLLHHTRIANSFTLFL